MSRLRPGDILSYSAGTTRADAEGFRFVRRAGEPVGSKLFDAVAERRPDLLGMMRGGNAPLIVNGYPANTGDFSFGVQVDSYLSFDTAARGLRLAREEDSCAIIVAQPLWLGELFSRFRAATASALPSRLIAVTGGYYLPRSLEICLNQIAALHDVSFGLVEVFGVAELDAACLIGTGRDHLDRRIYYPRDDVRLRDGVEALHLARLRADGSVSDFHPTGEFFAVADEGPGQAIVLLDGPRRSTVVRECLEDWSPEDWRRRTGYLRRGSGALIAQLRPGVQARSVPRGDVQEEEHFDFARESGMSWLSKPAWA